jgi:hypothetical protein
MPLPNRLSQFAALSALVLATACAAPPADTVPDVPVTRWDHRPEGQLWTLTALDALEDVGQPLVETVPDDIATFCPAYAGNGPEERRAFWVGLMSALAKHESTWRPEAAGGGGRWLGLLQIAPETARDYGCDLSHPRGLFDGATNIACAVRIIARQVARHGVVVGGPGNWGGVAADWGPMRKADKVAEMAAFTRAQSYCQPEPRLASLATPLSGAAADRGPDRGAAADRGPDRGAAAD